MRYPTIRNDSLQIPVFGEFTDVSTAIARWLSLPLEEPPIMIMPSPLPGK